MNYYTLEDKEADKQFLDGDPVDCKIALSRQQYNEALIKQGDKIVVMLSNGKKYMGNVVSLTFEATGGGFEGVLTIEKK